MISESQKSFCIFQTMVGNIFKIELFCFRIFKWPWVFSFPNVVKVIVVVMVTAVVVLVTISRQAVYESLWWPSVALSNYD